MGALSLVYAGLVAVVSAVPSSGGAQCTSEMDCQLNGICTSSGACACDAAWTGANCSKLVSIPPPCARRWNAYHSTSCAYSAVLCMSLTSSYVHVPYVSTVQNLHPAKSGGGFGHLGSNESSWGAGVIHDAQSGKWIMCRSRARKHRKEGVARLLLMDTT